jgi:hypothetical protein
MEGGAVGHNIERGPPKDHSSQICFNLVQRFVCPNAADPKKQARPKYFFFYFQSVGNFPVPYGKFVFKILYHTDV